jgi:hypothetical protein
LLVEVLLFDQIELKGIFSKQKLQMTFPNDVASTIMQRRERMVEQGFSDQ